MPCYALGEAAPELPEGERYWIAPNATLIGQVRLEEFASVWFGAVLRGDNEPVVLGARSNVQDLCVLHTDPGFPLTVGPDCTIGHRAILHGCIIGPNCLVGMGAILLNGARIGRDCLIAAGALIAEGREIPDNSLVVGSPGRVVRKLGEEDTLRLSKAAATYMARWRRYRAELRQAG